MKQRKNTIIVWPVYLDSKMSKSQGRRIPVNLAAPNITLDILREAAEMGGLEFEIEADKFNLLAAAVPRIASAIKDSMQADGMNVLLNNRRCAGQLIGHIHFHLIPRKESDGLDLAWPARKYADGEMDGYHIEGLGADAAAPRIFGVYK